MAMTPQQIQEWLKAAGTLAPLATAIGGAGQASADRATQQAQLAYQKQQDEFNNQLALYNAQRGAGNDQYTKTANARAAQAAFQQSLLGGQTDRAVSLANASPLGAEQNFVARMGMLGNSSKQMQNQPAPNYGGVVNPFSGMDLTPFGNDATVASLANRRKILASIYPEMDMGSIGDLGLTNTASADTGVANYAAGVAGQRNANEDVIRALLGDQLKDAQSTENQPQLPTLNAQGYQVAPQTEKKGGGFWSKLGKGLLKIAPIAAMAIPGLGPVASIALQAGLGAANGAASGGGLKGALLGGAVGGASAGLGGVTQAAAGTKLLPNLRAAILNPQSLIKVGSSFAPTPIQQAIDLGANMFLKGPQFNKPAAVAGQAPQISPQEAQFVSQGLQGSRNANTGMTLPSTRTSPITAYPNTMSSEFGNTVAARDPLKSAITTAPRSGGPMRNAITNLPPRTGGYQPPMDIRQQTPSGIPPEVVQYLLEILGQR